MTQIPKPQTTEYDPFYQGYIDQVIDKDIVPYLKEQKTEIEQFLQSLPADKIEYAYGPDKWTIKQVVRHMIDAERVFAYRLMSIARGEKKNLPGFEEKDYVSNANDSGNKFEYLIGEFVSLRSSNILMIQNLPDHCLEYLGSANDCPASARALVFIMAGHAAHHINVIKERYF